MDNRSIMSLNNDDDYMSENDDSEQAIDKNNHVVDESLMSTAEMVKGKQHKHRHSKCWKYFTIEGDKMSDGGCDLDEEDKEDGLDEEAEESGRKKTRLN
ncbi:hypothetical protein Bca4012_065808 [Brassica carinata]